MILKSYKVVCDGPHEGQHEPGCDLIIGPEHTSQKARYAANRAGWKRIVGKGRWDSRDLSPQCAAREEAEQ